MPTCNLRFQVADGLCFPPNPLPQHFPPPCALSVFSTTTTDDGLNWETIAIALAHPEFDPSLIDTVIVRRPDGGEWEWIEGDWKADCGINERHLAEALTAALNARSPVPLLEAYESLPAFLLLETGLLSHRVFLPLVVR
jgi:hypothetical protein